MVVLGGGRGLHVAALILSPGLTPADMSLNGSEHLCSFYFQIIILWKYYCLSRLLNC